MTLRGDKYETQEEVRFRLENTVVLYDGYPVYITAVTEPEEGIVGDKARVHFCPLPFKGGKNTQRRYLSSRKFDLTPFKMGYINYNNDVYFCSRQPLRQNKQGLSNQTLMVNDIEGLKANFNFGELIKCDSFVAMIKGSYPDFDKAKEGLDNGVVKIIAVSRSFCLVKDEDLGLTILYYKNSKCGLIYDGDKKISLSKKFEYLREEAIRNNLPV